MKKHLATITILTKDRYNNAGKIQEILTENGNLIMARMGVNPQRACVKGCTGLVAVVVEGEIKEINLLTKNLDKLYGVVARSVIITKN